MTSAPIIGVDFDGCELLVARVAADSGRLSIQTLTVIPEGQLAGESLLTDARVICAVPDTDVIVKSLHLPGDAGIPDIDRVPFELAASMLEPEDTFIFDFVPTGLDGRFLGMVFRKERLALLDDRLGIGHTGGYLSGGYQARAVALGRGYMHFCRPVAGDLVCLAELGKTAVSLCFLYRGHIVSVTHTPLGRLDYQRAECVERLAAELRTVMNFRLSSLFAANVSLPISALLLTGQYIDEQVWSILSEGLSTRVVSPEIDGSCLANSMDTDLPPERFLVSLGLTIN
jgi:hypothetical protein